VAELVPVTRKDPEAVRQTINGIRTYRETLRKRGINTKRLLKKNETLRDLAHQGHHY
jgi:DNA-binding protein H-NS